MIRKVFIGCGFILFLGSLIFVFYLRIHLSDGRSAALSLDEGQINGLGGGDVCNVGSFHVTTPARVLSENDTQAVNIDITLPRCDKSQTLAIRLDAPQFALSPSMSDVTMNIPAHQNTQEIKYGWVLTPQRVGTFAIAAVLFYEGQDDAYQAIGLTVTNAFGLNLWQAQLLSYIGSFLGTFFGPVLTFVWWYDRWKERKERKAKETNTAPTDTPATTAVEVRYPQR